MQPYLRKLYVSSNFDMIKEMAEIAAGPALEFINSKNKRKGKGKITDLKAEKKKKFKKKKMRKKRKKN